MSLAHEVETLLLQLGSSRGKLRIARADETPSPHALALSWAELDAVLPDGGLPRGVVELSAPRALGGSTSIALAAVRAGQRRSKSAWCAWLDPEGTLHAPGVVAAGVDLARMLVVRGPRAQLGRVAVKMVESGAFEVVVIDFDAVPGAERASSGTESENRGSKGRRRVGAEAKGQLFARKLALAAEPSGSTVLLLTDASRPHSIPWPVALRVELSRPSPCDLVVRVAKDKRARIGLAKTIPFQPPGFVFEESAAAAVSLSSR
ncbi:MAG: recombinase A [Polyangiaceae bacterium]